MRTGCGPDENLQHVRKRLLLKQQTIHHHRFTMALSSSGRNNDQRLLVALDAAKMGELTRLNEYQVESVAIEKRNYDEEGGQWELKSSDQINIGSSYLKCSMEAASQGLKKQLKPHIVTNYDEDNNEEEEGDSVVEEVDQVLRSSLLVTNFVDEQMKERPKSLLPEHILKKMGDMETSREKYSRDAIAALPSKTIPVYSAKPADMTRSRLRIAVPEEAVKGSVARKRRLDESKYVRIRDTCNCAYCKMPSPFQTQGYRALAKKQKQGADMKSAQPLNSEMQNGSKEKWAPTTPYATLTPQTKKSMVSAEVSHQLGFWSLHPSLTLTGTLIKRLFKVPPKKSQEIRSTSMISPPAEKKSLPFATSTAMSTYPAIPKCDDSDSIPPPPPLLDETLTSSTPIPPIPPPPSDDLSSSGSSRSACHSFGEAGDNPITPTTQTNRNIESSNPRVRVTELIDESLKSPASTASTAQLWSPSAGDPLKSPATTTPKPEAKLETPDQRKKVVTIPPKSQAHPGREVTLTEISFVPMESDEVSVMSSPVESARKSLAAARLKKKDFVKSRSKRVLKQRIGSEPIGSKSSHDPHRGRKIHTDSLGAKTSHESRRRVTTPDPLGSKSGHGRLHYHKGRKSGHGSLTRIGSSRERSASRSSEERKPVDPPMAKLKPAALKRTSKHKQNAMEFSVKRTAPVTSTGIDLQKENEGTPVNRTAKDKQGYGNPAERMDPRKRSATGHPSTGIDIISQASECDSPPVVAKSASTDSAKLSRQSSHRGLDADVRRLQKGLPGTDPQKEQEGAPNTAERMGPRKRSASVHSSTGIDILSQASEGASPPAVAKSGSTDSANLGRQSSQRGLAADVRRLRKGSRKPLAKGQATEAGDVSPAQKMGSQRSSSLSSRRLVRKSSSRNIEEAQQKDEATTDKMRPKSLSKTPSMRTIQSRASTSPVSGQATEAGNVSPAQKMGSQRSSSLSSRRLVRKSSSRNIEEAQQKDEATPDKMRPKSLSKTPSLRTIQSRASTSSVNPRLEDMASPLTSNARPDPPEEPKLKALTGHRRHKSSGALSKSPLSKARHVASSSPTKASQATRQESSSYSTNKKSSESPIPSRRKFSSESFRHAKFQSTRTLLDTLSSDSMNVRTPNTTKRQTVGDASFHGLPVDVLSSPTTTIEVTRMPTSLSLASPHYKTTAEKDDLPSWVTPGYSAKGKIGKAPSRHQNGSLPISKGIL
jgi:hypothetical protein